MTTHASHLRTDISGNTEDVVNRRSHEPAYEQICNLLREKISKGIYLPGSRLPSESELRRIHKVSPMTVRRAIQLLLDQGIVTTVQGSGTFVKAPDLGGATFSLNEFYDIFKDQDRAKVKLLEARTLKADADTAARLQLSEGQRVLLLRRLLLKDGDPVIFHKEYLIYDPFRPVIETELEVTTLYGLFERNGQTCLKRGNLTLEAMVLNPEEAGLLNTMPLQPAFRIEHLFYDFDETPISWGQFICRGDKLRFKTMVGFDLSR
ncbi:GntR family transcriptional regulator [Desulfobacula sp.]|uniref:GntR family transcriptional regulator n=1 Tax=Desulfobacula sp. TaxID=2593537 RepID=UPI00261E4C39|nr:GntR family transcriptional regulator [Desulfobacula sp.]